MVDLGSVSVDCWEQAEAAAYRGKAEAAMSRRAKTVQYSCLED